MGNEIFDDLLVLEMARNHWGSVERGKKIIKDYADVVKKHGIKAAVKLQVFDTDTFIHKDARLSDEEVNDGENTAPPGSRSRYIKKLQATKLTPEEFKELVDYTKEMGMISAAAPYDERSVDICKDIGVEILKIASHDTNTWTLIDRSMDLGLPMIVSTGVISDLSNIDRFVQKAGERNIPLSIMHCVSNYPSEDHELELNQIDLLKKRYPSNVIGFSAHDYKNTHLSHAAAYAKGARIFERHTDIDMDGIPVSKYCIVPKQAEEWFVVHNKVKEMLGGPSDKLRRRTDREEQYVNSVLRGVYASRDLPKGTVLEPNNLGEDFYMAIPCEEGQFSMHDIDKGITLKSNVRAHERVDRSNASKNE